ncbi:MAG: hypothetical protein MUO53_15045 [Maribacter sp.]|nr:hypothetical protein [Maribacter sp.]
MAGFGQDQLQMAPKNPRVVFSKEEWVMISAIYFGKDMVPNFEDVAHALELFANFKPAREFYPNWGHARAEATLKSFSE